MTAARYTVAHAEHGVAIVDETRAVVCFASEAVAPGLSRLLNLLDPSPEQLDVLLGKRSGRPMMKRLSGLRSAATCHRCGHPLPAGSPALWHPTSRLVRHVRTCPKGSG